MMGSFSLKIYEYIYLRFLATYIHGKKNGKVPISNSTESLSQLLCDLATGMFKFLTIGLF